MKDFVECMICHKKYGRITHGKRGHLNFHNITMKEYKERFPNAEITSESCREKHRQCWLQMPKEKYQKMIEKAVKNNSTKKAKAKMVKTSRERGVYKKVSKRFSGENSHMKTSKMREYFSWRMRPDGLGMSKHASSFITKEIALKRGKKIAKTCKKRGVYKRLSKTMKDGKAAEMMKKNGRISKGQKQLYDEVKQIYSDAVLEKPIQTKDGVKSVDIFIPSKNIAIEYDGLYWHNEATKEHDSHRQKLIENEGYKVIRIKEGEAFDIKCLIIE